MATVTPPYFFDEFLLPTRRKQPTPRERALGFTVKELRRRAVWANWRGIADLSLTGGYSQAYGSVASVPGREYSALAKVSGASQPHRVLVQVPDNFDTTKRCIVVTASSGSLRST